MKWIPLKIYQGNVVVKELETVNVIYNDLVSAVKITQNKEAISNYNNFREEIKKRIKELNDFYSKYINDSRIGLFENIKNKLEKLLLIKPKISSGLNPNNSLQNLKKSNSQNLFMSGNSRNNSINKSNSLSKITSKDNDQLLIEDSNIENMFTSSEKLFVDKLKEFPHWKEAFIEIRLSEMEYNILFKDNENDL